MVLYYSRNILENRQKALQNVSSRGSSRIFLFSDHRSNTVIPRVLQNIMRKYRVSQDMGKHPKWTKKYLKITPRRRQQAIIFSLFVTVTVIAIR